MIVLTEELLNDQTKLINIFEKEKETIYNLKKSQKKIKILLLDSMQKLSDSINITDLKEADNILKISENYKLCLEILKENIANLNEMINLLNVDDINIEIEEFNNKMENLNNALLQNNSRMKELLTIEFPSTTTKINSKENVIEREEVLIEKTHLINEEKVVKADSYDDFKICQTKPVIEIKENTLIISEPKGTVTLPYFISELEQILENEPNKYSTIEEIIEKKYTLDFKQFKFPAFARFKEAFKLMKIREKEPFKVSFDLGMELFFYYNLHPAIIAACKTVDELDIYLDYLSNNETHKFDCFKIVFDIPPMII